MVSLCQGKERPVPPSTFLIDPNSCREQGLILHGPQGTLTIPHREALKTLKQCADKGKLLYGQRELAADFYVPINAYIKFDLAEAHRIQVSTRICWRMGDFALIECDLIFRGPPHWIIMGGSLKSKCYFCLRDQENLCDDLLFNNGAYAEFIRIPERIVAKNTLIVPENVPLEHAALTEPLACAVHGLEDSRPRKGDIIAIIGGGPLGLMILHVAALAGYETIALVDTRARWRRRGNSARSRCPEIRTSESDPETRAFTPEKPRGRYRY